MENASVLDFVLRWTNNLPRLFPEWNSSIATLKNVIRFDNYRNRVYELTSAIALDISWSSEKTNFSVQVPQFANWFATFAKSCAGITEPDGVNNVNFRFVLFSTSNSSSTVKIKSNLFYKTQLKLLLFVIELTFCYKNTFVVDFVIIKTYKFCWCLIAEFQVHVDVKTKSNIQKLKFKITKLLFSFQNKKEIFISSQLIASNIVYIHWQRVPAYKWLPTAQHDFWGTVCEITARHVQRIHCCAVGTHFVCTSVLCVVDVFSQ